MEEKKVKLLLNLYQLGLEENWRYEKESKGNYVCKIEKPRTNKDQGAKSLREGNGRENACREKPKHEKLDEGYNINVQGTTPPKVTGRCWKT